MPPPHSAAGQSYRSFEPPRYGGNITTFVASLGIGGIAIALAAQIQPGVERADLRAVSR